MKKVLFTLSFVAIFLIIATGAWATNGDDIKWSQPPDVNTGVIIQSTKEEPIIADDWECTDPRPVTDVHFWGSYIGLELPAGNPELQSQPAGVNGFVIRIYAEMYLPIHRTSLTVTRGSFCMK